MTAVLLTAVLSVPAADPAARFTISPMAAPKPALKYQLLPEVRELKSGNAAQWYLRCFMEQRVFFFNKEVVAQRKRYQTMPLKLLADQDLRSYGGSALGQADWGARLDTVDWQVLDRVQNDGAELRLPELAPLRELAVALQVRFRGEVARGDYTNAIRTAKTLFAFARHLGEYPASVANRVGLEVAGLALDVITEMIQQPDCPNLYWALTDLPCPLVDLRRGTQGDRVVADTELKLLRDDAAMSDADLEEVVSRVSGRVGFAREQAGLPPRNVRAALAVRAKDADVVRAARQRIIDAGVGKVAVEGFSALQIILLDEKREFEARRDDELKLLGFKLWELDSVTRDKKLQSEALFADLAPGIVELRRAQGHLEQRVALLRQIGAIRLYAAAHEKKLPEKLDNVGVPLPVDPFTGKPFGYKFDGPAANLIASDAMKKEFRFVIVINK
jgi:hypothetical protein